MHRFRLFVVALLLAAAAVGVPAAADAVVVRRLDLPVTNPMPAERIVASGVLGVVRRPLVLQADIGRNRAWVTLTSSSTSATGAFRFAFGTPRRLGALRLRAVAVPARGPAVATPLRLVTVTPPVARLGTVRAGVVGGTLRMTVVASPPRAGRLVHVQRRRTGTVVWTKAGSSREGRTGSTPVAVPLGAVAGTYDFRAVFAVPTGAVASPAAAIRISAPAAAATGPVRPAVTLQPAPGPGAPALESLVGADTDYVSRGDRWDPCRAISYRVNVAALPEGIRAAGSAAVSAAVATLSRDSGLQFRALGETAWSHPLTGFFVPPPDRPADSAMTIAFVSRPGDPLDEAGHAYVQSVSASMTGPGEIVRGDVVLFVGQLTDPAAPGTFDAGALRETLLHELGHAVGLSHANGQALRPGLVPEAPYSEYQRGDRAGLLAVGSPRGCLAALR